MRITVVRTNRLSDETVFVYRPNRDRFSPHFGERREHLVISAPTGMSDSAIVAAATDRLSDQEVISLCEALGLGTTKDRPEG